MEKQTRSTKRDEWQKHIQQWAESGLTAQEYARKAGLNAKTLENWKSKLRRLARPQGAKRPTGTSRGAALPWVELPPVLVSRESRFELELAHGRRVHVPSSFEPEPLRRLLRVLEETP